MVREAQCSRCGVASSAPRLRSRVRRFFARTGWLVPAALAVLVPKCPLCLAGYIAAAAGLGFAGKEVCGVSPPGLPAWVAPAGIAAALASGIFWVWHSRPAKRQARPKPIGRQPGPEPRVAHVLPAFGQVTSAAHTRQEGILVLHPHENDDANQGLTRVFSGNVLSAKPEFGQSRGMTG